jgi:tripartite-type tricarboxylate transporter receptor subunit TctC
MREMLALNLSRRKFLLLAAGAAALPGASRIAKAQNYPARPVRLIIGQPPGTAPDTLARLLSQWLSERLGQPFIVENRPGAGTNVATEAVVRAAPDGYTLLLSTLTNAINETLYDKLNFNFVRDIAPVALIGNNSFVMVVTPSLPSKTVPEFIAYAKANPGKINMASAGSGTAPHVFGELFKTMAGIDLVHVQYRGSFYPDLFAGRVQVAFISIAGAIAFIRDTKLRALAVTTARRSELLPDIPSMGDFVPAYEASAWLGIGAPGNTPVEVIAKLNTAINAITSDPNIKARLVGLGVEPMSMTPAEFGKFTSDETEKWAKVIKLGGITSE